MNDDRKKHGQERPGGRTETVRLAVAQTVLNLLKEGRTHFSMAEVADQAGIHRSTLYRRWQTQEELIHEAMTLHAAKIKIPDTGSWEKDIKELVKSFAEFVADPVEMAIVRAMVNPDNPNLAKQVIDYWTPLMEQHALPIKRAQQRGEISNDLESRMVLSFILSPLLIHGLILGKPASASYLKQMTELVIGLAKK